MLVKEFAETIGRDEAAGAALFSQAPRGPASQMEVRDEMSTPNDPNDPEILEPIDDLMLIEGDQSHEQERVSSSVRDIASRIPESLASIGRDISRTVERALSAKDDYVVAVKLSHEAQDRLEQLVQAGVFRSRAEAAAFLIDEGIKAQAELFARVTAKLSEIERLRAELRGMIAKPE